MGRRIARGFRSVGIALTVGVVATVTTSAGSAVAAAPAVVGSWELDEPRGASIARDSSGGGRHGRVGDDVRTGVVHDGATGYRFPSVAPNSPPTRPGHLVTVPHDRRLNPGADDYTVTVRFRTTRSPSNIVQKGQRGASGGYWKIEQDRGRPRCTFRGGGGQGRSVAAGVRIDDGRWHTVECRRTGSSVTIAVDGVRRGKVNGSTGTIANSWVLVIGGKSRCDQRRTGCDYFSGNVDFVRVEKG